MDLTCLGYGIRVTDKLRRFRNFMQDDLDADEVDVDATGFGDNLATTDNDVQLVAQAVNDLALVELSDDDPEDIGAAADDGDGIAASKYNHSHRLPTDNTLEFDGSAQLGVNVTDVIEHLQERIRYFTTTGSHTSDAGASVGQAYDHESVPEDQSRRSMSNSRPLVGR